MKILIWVKEKNLEKLKEAIQNTNSLIHNKPPKFYTFDPGTEYLTVMIDYQTFVILKDATKDPDKA